MRIVLRIAWIPFHNEFILTITIHITYRTIVGRIRVTSTDVVHVGRTVKLQQVIPSLIEYDRSDSVSGHTFLKRHQLKCRCWRRGHAHTGSMPNRIRRHDAVFQQEERRVCVITAQKSPSKKRGRLCCRDAHKTTIQFLLLKCRRVRALCHDAHGIYQKHHGIYGSSHVNFRVNSSIQAIRQLSN